MVLTAGCHYSRSEGRQQDRRKKETADKGREVGGERQDEGPEEEQVKKIKRKEVKGEVGKDLLTLSDSGWVYFLSLQLFMSPLIKACDICIDNYRF